MHHIYIYNYIYIYIHGSHNSHNEFYLIDQNHHLNMLKSAHSDLEMQSVGSLLPASLKRTCCCTGSGRCLCTLDRRLMSVPGALGSFRRGMICTRHSSTSGFCCGLLDFNSLQSPLCGRGQCWRCDLTTPPIFTYLHLLCQASATIIEW